jgi:uncharacterized protein (DUF4415 family)
MKKKSPDPEAIDKDNPELTREDFRRARPLKEGFPAFHSALKRFRGAQKQPKKKQVTLRLDAEVLKHFKSMGQGWQTSINQALLDSIHHT